MNHEHITERIRNLRTPAGEPGPACPDDHQIAAAVDGRLNRADRDAFDRHVSDCEFCVARIGTLNGLRAVDVLEAVPDITLARAKRLTKRAGIYRHAPRWAAAAVIVLAISFAVNQYSPVGEDPDTTESSLPPVATPQTVFRQSRNINPNSLRPKILTPNEGTFFDAGNSLFRWTETAGSLYYDIRIVTWEGDMIWQERVHDTEWGLPETFELEPGTEYYVRVDAYLAEAKSVSSRHVLFKVKEQP